MAKVKTLNFDGRKVDVTVDENGRFFASLDGEHLADDSLKKLEDRLRRKAKGRVKVPATIMATPDDWDYNSHRRTGLEFQDVYLTGWNESRRGASYRDKANKAGFTETVGTMLRLSRIQKEELDRLWKALKAAKGDWDAAVKKYRMNVQETIAAAAHGVDVGGDDGEQD